MTTVTLPCLTLRQPWASLVLYGAKTIETRKTGILRGFTGPLLIHVSKQSPDEHAIAAEVQRRYGIAPAKFRAPAEFGDVSGCVAGIVHVDDCFRARVNAWDPVALCPTAGLWCARLSLASWLWRPIPARGRLGLWSAEVPVDVLPEWAREAVSLAPPHLEG